MCIQSVVMDYMKRRVPLDRWTPPAYQDFQELLRRIDKLDRDLGEPDCVDPVKAAYIKQIENRLAELEKKVAEQKKAP
jgi:tetrahydromethanopterin S-methyltransferase subunit G